MKPCVLNLLVVFVLRSLNAAHLLFDPEVGNWKMQTWGSTLVTKAALSGFPFMDLYWQTNSSRTSLQLKCIYGSSFSSCRLVTPPRSALTSSNPV